MMSNGDRSSQISMAFLFGANFHTVIQFRNFLVSNSFVLKKKTPKVEKQFDFIFKKSPFFFTIASQKRQMFKFFIAYFFHSQIWAKSAHGRLPSQLHHKNERKTLHPIIGEKVRLIFLFIKNINLK